MKIFWRPVAVAQLLEHLLLDQKIEELNPSERTIQLKFQNLKLFSFIF